MKIHTKFIEQSLEHLIRFHEDPKEGDLLVSAPGIMETCAPYIGRMCAEFLDGEWCWMPYSRDTDYFANLDEAEDVLVYWDMDYGCIREASL